MFPYTCVFLCNTLSSSVSLAPWAAWPVLNGENMASQYAVHMCSSGGTTRGTAFVYMQTAHKMLNIVFLR